MVFTMAQIDSYVACIPPIGFFLFFFQEQCLCFRKSIFAQDAPGLQGVFVPVYVLGGGDGTPDGAAVSLSQQA